MMNDQELMDMFDKVSTEYHGQIDDLYQAIGMLYVGRLYGWRVMRLSAPRRIWTIAFNLFGDPKTLMPERGLLAHKSLGLKVCDAVGDYWEFVKGNEAYRMDRLERKAIE
jgi:hypothetical protein